MRGLSHEQARLRGDRDAASPRLPWSRSVIWPMSEAEELVQLRSYGVQLRDYLQKLDLPAESAARAGELANRASRLVAEADGPLRIGVVGEFSSGKSLLLGVLLNNPCLLPTSSQPTTGNVTELHFVSEPAGGQGGTTRIGKVQIRYFIQKDLNELDGRMLDELGAAMQRFGVCTAEDLRAASARGIEPLIALCRRAWQLEDPVTRKLIRELLHTRVAARQGATLIGATRTVDPGRLTEILQIPRLDDPDSFPDTSAAGWNAGASSDGHPTWAYPLVDRVMIDVVLPPGVWDLSTLPEGSEFVLLDFPGVGGGLTHVRDLYLTQLGLRNAHSVVVMVDSGKPGGQAADTFYGFLRELTTAPPDGAAGNGSAENASAGPDAGAAAADTVSEPLASRLLYCGTRFDMLNPPGEAELAASLGAAQLTVRALLGRSDPLNALLQSGHRPGPSSMSAVLSSVTAIALGGLSPVPAELGQAGKSEQAMSGARRWRQIAGELTASGTGHDLASALREYAKDGGIAGLRALLERHVTEHGLGQRVAKLREQATEAERSKAELIDLLESDPAVQRPAPDDPVALASRLLNDLGGYRNKYERLLPQLRDPAMIEVRPGWSLRDDVAQQAAEMVIGWEQWGEVLGCVRNAVIVPPENGDSEADLRVALGLPVLSDSSQSMPESTDDFVEVFTDTCRSLREYSRSRALKGLERWFSLRSRDGSALRQRVEQMLSAQAKERLKQESLTDVSTGIGELLDPAGNYKPDLLYEVAARRVGGQPQQPNEQAGADQDQAADPGGPASVPAGFPLRGHQAAPWSADAASDDAARHVIRMLRMRSAIIASVTDIALSHLDDLQYEIHKMLHGLLTGVRLPEGLRREAFINAVTGETRSGSRAPVDHVAALDAIRPSTAN
jgi:hypothetical protein